MLNGAGRGCPKGTRHLQSSMECPIWDEKKPDSRPKVPISLFSLGKKKKKL